MDETGDRRRAFSRALLAAALAAAGHVGAFVWLTSHSLSPPPPDSVLGTPIELDLLAVAPPPPEAAPAPPPPDPPPTEAAPPPTPEPPTPEAQPTPDPSPPPAPAVTPPPDAVILPAPPPPKPRPTPRPPAAKPQKPKPAPEKAQKARLRDETRPAVPQRAVASGSDISNWRGEVMARINAFKPSANGASGTAVVAFSVDGGGRVVSASVVRSSGDASLDAACVAMIRRASPLPPPPAGLGGRVNLTAPVRFQ